ncbi:hypothetical protein K6U27_10890 [Vibrio fluvialis]|uniref:hypothetical protein n=1 Tax=Vibrio fluvialis TaxID=676 RepID=UPI001EEBDF9B|nr:hypothetical protein [Vibrio fluvialis]MCG6373178.1 hypothetical protein [Vibrio fluvialis]
MKQENPNSLIVSIGGAAKMIGITRTSMTSWIARQQIAVIRDENGRAIGIPRKHVEKAAQRMSDARQRKDEAKVMRSMKKRERARYLAKMKERKTLTNQNAGDN